MLTADEVTRADRFHFDRHRRRFIVRRGVLRLLLAEYLERQPEELRFEEGEKGKPFVKVFDKQGKFVAVVADIIMLTGSADGGGGISAPPVFDIATDNQGRVLVLDPKRQTVRIFEWKTEETP